MSKRTISIDTFTSYPFHNYFEAFSVWRLPWSPPALRKLRTYDVDFSNDAWRTLPDATALAMTSSHHFTPPRQVSARLAPLVWNSVVFVLPSSKPLDGTKPWARQALPAHPVRKCNRCFINVFQFLQNHINSQNLMLITLMDRVIWIITGETISTRFKCEMVVTTWQPSLFSDIPGK